jgi:hypothetical protein
LNIPLFKIYVEVLFSKGTKLTKIRGAGNEGLGSIDQNVFVL